MDTIDLRTTPELEAMKVAELKTYADETFGLKFKSKATKTEIIKAVREATVEAAREFAALPQITLPLTMVKRRHNYAIQNGGMGVGLTPKQVRRTLKKARHAAKNGKGFKVSN